jgi:hypothetical protein
MCATRTKWDRPVPDTADRAVHDTAKWDSSERGGPSARHGCDGIPHGMGRAGAVRGGIGGEGRAYARLRAAARPRVRAGTHPLHPRVCAGVVGGAILLPSFPSAVSQRCTLPSAVSARRRRHWPVLSALQAKHAESLAVAVKVARVLTRLCEQVTHAHTHERTLSHTRTRARFHTHARASACFRTHAHASALMHTRAFRQAGRQAGKAVKITSTGHSTRTQLHAHARARLARRLEFLRCAAADARRRCGGDGARLRALHAARVRCAEPALRWQR